MLCSCTKAIEDRVDALENRVSALESKVNDNASAIEKLVNAAAKAVTVTSVVRNENGYTITFSDNTTAVLTNGIDGNDAPVVGVKDIDGILCWTIGGEPVMDGDNYIPVTGTDGTNGEDGQDGKTPLFKIEDGAWKVSFDGTTWEDVPVTGTVEPKFGMEETDAEYIFTLGETVITILKENAFAIKVQKYELETAPGRTLTFSYTLVGADNTTHVVVEEAKGFEASVDEGNMLITVKAPADKVSGYVLVKAVRNSDGKYSAQYISIDADVYGTFGDIIISSENEYLNW